MGWHHANLNLISPRSAQGQPNQTDYLGYGMISTGGYSAEIFDSLVVNCGIIYIAQIT